jgi:hypothetical protein
MPITIKLFRLRRKYEKQGMKLSEYYRVISYDMRRLLVTNEKADRVYFVAWRDAELIQSEMLIDQNRPNIALLSELRVLQRAMSKLSSSMSKKVKQE